MSRIAVVHDYLTQFGGAERVVLALSEAFDAPVYTSLYQPRLTFGEFSSRQIHTTALQRVVPQGRFRLAAPFISTAFRSMDLRSYDTVIVSTSGFAHHVRHPNAFVYCHTPPRFIYDIDEYGSGPNIRGLVKALLPILRRQDQHAARRHSSYAANSAVTAERIKATYAKTAPVIHPPLRTGHLPSEVLPLPKRARALMVARLQPYKRADIAIEACALARIPLTIVGDGMGASRARTGVQGDVTFLGRVSDSAMANVFAEHSVVLAPGIEDFGLGVVEANYAGRPVVARAAGGALETVTDGVTGALIPSDDPSQWAVGIERVLDTPWDPARLRTTTQRFGADVFIRAITDWIGR